MTNDSPNEARRYGTPVFPPASENDRTSPVADTSSFGLCSTDSTMSKTLETGKIYPGSDYQPQSGVPQTENSPSYQQPNYAIAAAHLTQSQPGLKSLHAMTSGYWQQSAIITPPEQMILPGNYAPMFPTADSFSASMAYTSAATPLGASWPWMMSVGSNIYNQSTSFRDSVQPGSPNIAPALSVSIMRGAMDMASQYNSDSGIKSITASAQLNAIPEYSRPSAFHVVSRDHTDSQMSAHESSTDQILDEDSSNTMPDKSFRALKSKRTPYRRTRRRVKSRPGSLEEILNDSINSSTPDLSHGSWMKEGATAVYKSCPYGWSSNTDEAELNENSENEVKNQQPACSNSSRPSSTRSRPLNRNALKQMRQWYEAHIDRPYPTTAEKLQLARLGGIKLSQVNSWFANQRTRSCNTRPKKKLQRLHSRLKDVAVELEQMTQGIVSAADLELQLRSIVDSYLA
ncbi:unnamed protein product [Echinostoma caproni]|uniref:Homeobox domain-containing protein n=1 Tax=Echinostoma caproni TaxID=27848 RepID=A0A183A6U6_9TREM|nr:unnamed protein product [Echinostoma caproni]